MTHGSEKRVRDRHLTIRLSVDERAAIDQKAERAGLTAGSWGRQIMLDAVPPRQVRRPPVERKELARLLAEFGKIGSNLNQLAKAANAGVVVYESEIDAAIADLHAMRHAVLSALGREP
jgi:hypothetical protein